MPGNFIFVVASKPENGLFLAVIVLTVGKVVAGGADVSELLNGEFKNATWCVHGKTVSLHTDMDAAYDTMTRVREMEKRGVQCV
jgi:hypothetical protein